jgi:Tol biopolymer transport system component
LRSKNDSIKTLYSVPILGGESRALIADIDSPPTFSPDGGRIAFLRRNSREGITALLIADADGSNIRPLTTRQSPQNFVLKPISWSPDGKTIACFSILTEDVSERSLVLLDAETGEEKLVSKQKWNDVDSVVWANNSEMLLSATGPAKPLLLQIWLVDPYQDTSRQLTDDLSDYSDLTIANETGEVAAAQSQLESYIWLEELQSPAASRRLSQNKYDGVSGITWDPNGDLIFSSVINGKNSLQRASMADLSIKPITADGKFVFRNPVATPDRKYIIYSSNQEQPESIWRMDIDGKNQRRLVSVPADLADYLSDSQTVLFSAQHNGHVALWKVSIDGGDPQLLSDATAFRPKISPDRQNIAFYFRSGAKAPWQIGVMPVNEDRISQVIDLPKTVALSSQFSWTSDGKGLILIDSRGLVNNLWSYPLNGQPPTQLTNLNDESFPRIIHFAFSPDGSRIALTRSRFVSDVVLIASQPKK